MSYSYVPVNQAESTWKNAAISAGVAVATMAVVYTGLSYATAPATTFMPVNVGAQVSRVAPLAATGRREALMIGAAAAGLVAAGPASAAYGDSANVFGKKPEVDQFFKVSGPGWSTKMMGKYNPSKERSEFPGIVGRWEDNFDAVSYSVVTVNNVGKNSVTELGDLDAVREAYVRPMLGIQSFEGQTLSEGGFADGKVAAAALLDQQKVEKGGKTYYQYELLTRTADGNEGGRHQLFSIAASGGNLYILKHQAGDKRWFKGLMNPIRESIAEFTVA